MGLRLASRQARLVVFGYNAATMRIGWTRNPVLPQYAGSPLSLRGGQVMAYYKDGTISDALSSIVYCGHCGDVFQRTHWNCRGKKKVVWRCVSRLHKKDTEINCPARTVTEADLHEVVVRAVNEVFTRQEELLPPLRASIARALERNNNEPVADLDARIAGLEQEILKRNRARQDYDDLGREVIRLREEKYQLQLEDAEKEGMRKKLTELEETLVEIGGQVTEYYDALVRKLIERITVYDDKYVVEFKSGIEIDVRL